MCLNWFCNLIGGYSTKEPNIIFKKNGRGCTDFLWILIYTAACAVMIVILATAAGKGGNPYKIIYGVDYMGRTCGVDGGVKGSKYLAWPYVSLICPECLDVRVCLPDCASTQTSALMAIKYNSTQFLHYCLPLLGGTVTASDIAQLGSNFDSDSNSAQRAYASILTTWWVILVSVPIALVISFAFNWLTEKIAGWMVFFALLLVVVGGFLLCYALLKYASTVNDDTPGVTNRKSVVTALGWICFALTILFILVIFALRERLYIAIETVKEASHAYNDMKQLLIFPFLPLFVACSYITFFAAVVLFIVSVTTSTGKQLPSYLQVGNAPSGTNWASPQFDAFGNYTSLGWDNSLKNAFGYAFFHFLWTSEIFIFFTYTVIAATFASWYFSRRDEHGKKIRGDGDSQLPNYPVLHATWLVIRYHLGTIILAALLIAIIKFIRAVLTYIEKTLHGKGEPNKLQKALFKVLQCCLKCLECCCEKIEKNLLIWTSIWGDNFATSACSSFALIFSNLGRFAALNMVGHFIVLLGKVLSSLITTGICGLIIYAALRNDVESPALPLAIIFIFSWVVCALVLLVLEVGIDTMFLCFLVDEKYNIEKGGQAFASPSLKAIVDKHHEKSKVYEKQFQDLKANRAKMAGEEAFQPMNAEVQLGQNANTKI